MNTNQPSQNYLIPLSILGAGVLIAGALLFVNQKDGNSGNNQPSQVRLQQATSLDKVRKVTSEDHIKGNPNAPVKVVEYSDFECPFCKRFHPTMQRAIDEYGKDGQVAWVYRHFPLDQLHPKNGRRVAVASECVNEIAGNDAFWSFADRFFELTPSNDRTDLSVVLPQIYRELGINQAKIEECLSSGKYDNHIQDDIDNAITTGGRGTPWSVVIGADGTKYPLSGAQPYNAVKQLIELGLKNQ